MAGCETGCVLYFCKGMSIHTKSKYFINHEMAESDLILCIVEPEQTPLFKKVSIVNVQI